MMKRVLLLLSASLLLATAAVAQLTEYRVLLPVLYPAPLPGAYNSQWQTSFAVFNPTSTEFTSQFCSGSRSGTLGCPRPYIPETQLLPGETQTDLYAPGNTFSGYKGPGPRLLYFTPFQGGSAPAPASALQFQLRAADISRASTNAGTEVPVVKQEQFRKSTTSLLNVPVHPNFRLTLRLYETLLPISDFTVRVYDQATNVAIGGADVRLVFQNDHDLTSMFNPPYLQIGDLTTLIPAGTQLPSTLRIEIEPRTSGSEFWAFVSITNNETQHLTLVTPQ